MPKLIKIISIVGTIAMLAVGGGIIAHETHALAFLDETIKSLGMLSGTAEFLSQILFGVVIGLVAVKLLPVLQKIIGIFRKNKS